MDEIAGFVSLQPLLRSPAPLRSSFKPLTDTWKERTAPNLAHSRLAFEPRMLFERFFKPKTLDIDELSDVYPAIRVADLSKTFEKKVKGKGKRKKESRTITALDGVSFTVERGQVLGLLGPNSSGKTTALRCIATMCEPDAGSVEFYGMNVLEDPYLAREMLGFVAQSAGLDKVLTGREHLELFADLAHLDRATKRRNIDALVQVLNLEDFIDRQAGVYSGGVVRRIDMAIALLHQPPILILDEPTVGLDLESRQVIWDVLKDTRRQGGTIVLTSHYLEEVDVLSDKVVIMDKGVTLAEGSPTELKNSLGGDRISIRLQEFTTVGQAEEACRVLQERGLAQSALINRRRDNAVELVVDASNTRVGGEIVQTLSELGFDKLFSFSQSKPSLDDVYLAATGVSISDADASAKAQRSEQAMRQESMT